MLCTRILLALKNRNNSSTSKPHRFDTSASLRFSCAELDAADESFV